MSIIMKKKLLFAAVSLLMFITSNAQTLVQSFPFPRYTSYNYFWAIAEVENNFWIGSDYSSTSGTYINSWMYKTTKQGVILDSLQTPIKNNHGLVWDGTHFWIVEGYRAPGSRIFRMDISGQFVDTFFVAQVIGGIPIGIGDIALDGDKIWFTVFSPDFVSYPNSYAYAFNRFTKQLTDTLPLYGRQPLGIAVRGDTIFYVNENQYSNETERIYAISKTTKDSLFSFPAPDPDGNCNPKGLYWDGSHLWLVAERIGNSSWVYKTLYKYEISGGGTPIITTSTNSIDFGNVIVGMNEQRTFSISNIGSAPLVIDSFVIANQQFTSTANLPVQIPVDSSKDFTINFSPQSFGNVNSILSIHSNDGGTPVKTISLTGKGINSGSVISVSDTILDFQFRDLYSLSSKNFEIRNLGSEPIFINSVQTQYGFFSFDTVGFQFPIQIDTGSVRAFRIWFEGNSTGMYSDSLTIINSSINLPQIIIALKANVVSRSFNYGDEMWSVHIPDNPSAYIQDYKPMSIKHGFSDIPGKEVLMVASRNYYVMRVNPYASYQGDIFWKFNTATNNNNTGAVMFQDAMQIRSDIDNDGYTDLVFGCGGGNEFVYTLSGRTGNLIWAYGDSIDYNRGDINGLRADKDFNGDNIPDVIISASGSSAGGRHAVICLNGLTGAEIFNKPQTAQYTFDVETTQWGGVICVDQGNGGPYFLNAFNDLGNPLWSQSIPDVCWSIKQIDDIDNDAAKDIAAFIGGTNVRVMAFSGANGSVLWQKSYTNFATFSTIKIVEDRNFNGYKDLIFSGKEGVFRLDSKTGTTVWENFVDGSYVFDVDEGTPIDWGGELQVIAGTKNANFFKLNIDNGSTLFTQNFGSPNDNAVERVKFVQSYGRPYHTVVIGTRDGRILGLSGGLYVVPVELNSFSYSQTFSSVIFNWSTATETNNNRFEIDRDGVVVGRIKGSGTSTVRQNYSFEDRDVPKGKHIYKLIQIDYDGASEILKEVEIDVNLLPKKFQLYQNYPNPFNPATTVKFDLPEDAIVKIDLFNSIGEKIISLLNSELQGGSHHLNFNAKDISSGIYFLRMTAENRNGNSLFTSTKKITLVR